MSLTINSVVKDLKNASWFKPLGKSTSPWTREPGSTDRDDKLLEVQHILDSGTNTASGVGSLCTVSVPSVPTADQTTANGKPWSKSSPHPAKVVTESLQIFLACSVDPNEISDLHKEADLFAHQLRLLRGTVVPYHRGLYRKFDEKGLVAGAIAVYDFQSVTKMAYPFKKGDSPFVELFINAVDKLHRAGVRHNRLLEFSTTKIRGENVHKLKYIGVFRDRNDNIHVMISGLRKATASKESPCHFVQGRPCCGEMARVYDFARVPLQGIKAYTSWKDWLDANF